MHTYNYDVADAGHYCPYRRTALFPSMIAALAAIIM